MRPSTSSRRTRAATATFAIVAHLCIACGGDADAPDPSPASSIPIDSGALAPVPTRAAIGDTAVADAAADSPRATTLARASADPADAPATTPAPSAVTAPADHAAAPAVDPAPEEPRAAIAPESATIAPRVVPPPSSAGAAEPRREDPVSRPFAVGEHLIYEVKFGPLSVGTATMQVRGIEQVRGIPAYHIRFEVRGGNRLYRVEDVYESWFDARTLASLRYVQNIREGGYRRNSVFEIYPDRQQYVEEGKAPQPSVAQPLDEGSFIYWMRTIPLEVGRTYEFHNYFRPDRNPVTITVLRRERVRVPAGEFDAIVVRPTIRTRGIFSEGGHAEIWFADDSTRRILQMKSRLSFGSLNLHLK